MITASSRSLCSLPITLVLLCFLLSACATTPWYSQPPSKPEPMNPVAGAQLGSTKDVVFSWRVAEQTEFYEFHIFNAVTSDIDRYMVRQISPKAACRSGVCSIGLPITLPESTRHAWRVRAINVAGASAWTRNVFSWQP